ncbi:MAG: hypothetical protein U0517_04085 [Candidatus Andersenbacteria bacterium]
MPKKVGRCRVCDGNIVERRVVPRRHGPIPIGPGSRSHADTVVDGFYCDRCGICYRFIDSKYATEEHRAELEERLNELKKGWCTYLNVAVAQAGWKVALDQERAWIWLEFIQGKSDTAPADACLPTYDDKTQDMPMADIDASRNLLCSMAALVARYEVDWAHCNHETSYRLHGLLLTLARSANRTYLYIRAFDNAWIASELETQDDC